MDTKKSYVMRPLKKWYQSYFSSHNIVVEQFRCFGGKVEGSIGISSQEIVELCLILAIKGDVLRFTSRMGHSTQETILLGCILENSKPRPPPQNTLLVTTCNKNFKNKLLFHFWKWKNCIKLNRYHFTFLFSLITWLINNHSKKHYKIRTKFAPS